MKKSYNKETREKVAKIDKFPFYLKFLQLCFEWKYCLVDLLLVVPVEAGQGEEPHPAQGQQGHPVDCGTNVGQHIHPKRELNAAMS